MPTTVVTVIPLGTIDLKAFCSCGDPCPDCCAACCDLGPPESVPPVFATFTTSGCSCAEASGSFELVTTGGQQWQAGLPVSCSLSVTIQITCGAGTGNKYQMTATTAGQTPVVVFADSQNCSPFQLVFNNVPVGVQSDSGGDCNLVVSFIVTL